MQSIDRLLGQEVDGCYQLLKDSRRWGEGGGGQVSAYRYAAHSCPHYQQGCCHWVVLADTQASHAALSTAARLQLLVCASLLLHVCSLVIYMFLCLY